MTTVSIDFETRSRVDLREAGVYRYAEDESTGIWCFAYAFDDEEPAIWHPGLRFPDRLHEHIAAGRELRAWNASFERIIWRDVGVPRYGFPPVHDEQWVCTAAEAAAMALPRSLDECARVTRIAFQKDSEGHNLMMRMSRPRKLLDDGTLVWWDVPERTKRLYAYCLQDVRTERALGKVLHRLLPSERALYLLNERINDRGVRLDRELALAAQRIATEGAERASAAVREATGGAVIGVTNTGRLREWLRAQGIPAESVAKAAVRDLLADPNLPARVRGVLEARAEAGRSSVAKIETALAVACKDNRVRGLSLYHGASTGRFTGRLLQPHNFPRGDVARVEDYIPDILAGRYATIDLVANPVAVVSSLLRGLLCASPGHDFIAGDFSAIEARVLNWLAGQADMLEHFRAYDAGDARRDPYRINAARLYDIPIDDVQKYPHRQTGKFQELGCGYGMGAAKAVTAAKDVYQLDLSDEQAKEIVENYRSTHRNVTQLWYDANDAAMSAVTKPGSVQLFGPHGTLKFSQRGQYLYLFLPSHRYLVYAAPRIAERETPWGEMRPAVEIYATDSYTRQWRPTTLYGGLIVENVVQAVSRDLLAEAMKRLEAHGYANVMNVHDEIVCEVPQDFGSIPEFENIMRTLPAWAEGCPVNVEAWRGARYRK